MKKKYIYSGLLLLALSCKKNGSPTANQVTGSMAERTETSNGITYRLFIVEGQASYKGIVVMGSGNDENNPSSGSLNGAHETEFCEKAASNGYIGAIVQYRKTPGVADWNASAQMIAADYDLCIQALSSLYHTDKSRSVVGGFSYASFMLLTDISIDNTLSYTKGLLAPCGATGLWDAQHFVIPIFSIACSGHNEGDFSGKELYDQIPANSPVKSNSGGTTDNSCNTHCGGNWTNPMYNTLVQWLP
ncbi:MAG: hypothetical protein M3N30_03815 [Bacteroidota bacterium]|nr:hypothetical protein [Bacteroidota bacterium]